MTSAPPTCPKCGTTLSPGVAPGACAACLLEDVLPAAALVGDQATEDGFLTNAPLVQHFGPYELLEEIGRGGMGVIYRARHPGLDRLVALKMLLAGEFADAKARERLLREARIAARLSHPGIVTIHDVGEHQGRPYFAMEYVPGRNLAQYGRDGLLPLDTATRYVEQIARAVHHAHQHGVIHRDLKPANVLISPDDQPKLTDFGLTKSLVDPTQTLESAGSPNFMAPEQADPSLGTTGTPTDIFGVGAILYHLLIGRPPALGETLNETLRLAASCEPVPPRRLRPALPRDLETITLKCLEREPGRRYGSALEVAEELARWRNHEPIHARPATTSERMIKWVRRRPLVAALGAACALAGLAGFVGVTWQWRRAEANADAARASEWEALRSAYVAEMASASTAVQQGNWGAVRAILQRTRPGPGKPDLRGWEWRYLWQASRIGAEGRVSVSSKRIGSMAALEDGRTVAFGEQEGEFLLWDVPTGREVFRMPGILNRVRHPFLAGGAPVVCRVAVVPGTGLLAYTDCRSPTNGFVHLWHVARRELVRSIPVQGIPRHLAASPDGQQVACSLMRPDRRTLVFDIAEGRTIATLETDFSSYSACHTLAFSADGRALSLEDVGAKCFRVVEIATGHDIHRFPLQQDYPLSAVFSPDGRWLVTGGGFDESRPRVEVWDLHTGNRHAELPASSPFALHFSRDGRRLVAGLSIWRVPEFTLERRFDGVDSNGKAVLLLAEGDTFLSEEGVGGVLRWSLKVEPPNRGGRRFEGGYENSAFLPRGRGILLVHTNGTVERALAPWFRREPIPELGTNAASIASLPERRQIAVGRRDGSLSLHEADTYIERARFRTLSNSPPWEAFWVPAPGLIVVRTQADRLEVWDPVLGQRVWHTGLLLRELSPPTAQGVLWQVHADGWLAGYDVRRRRVIHQPLDHDGMHRLGVSPDGQWVLTTSPQGPKRLVATATWRTVDSFPNLDRPVPHGGAFWPNEPRIGFSGLLVVDQATGRELLRLDPAIPFPYLVRISDDGSLVLNVGERNTACLWWAPSWEEIRRAEADGLGPLSTP